MAEKFKAVRDKYGIAYYQRGPWTLFRCGKVWRLERDHDSASPYFLDRKHDCEILADALDKVREGGA